jgi:hypothetical protein
MRGRRIMTLWGREIVGANWWVFVQVNSPVLQRFAVAPSYNDTATVN